MKKLLSQIARQSGFVRKNWVQGFVLDKEYKVIHGSLRVKADKDDAWLFALSQHSECIFDIGSNVGQAALMMLYNKNIKKMVMVDPNPEALAIAAENMIHNHLSLKTSFVSAFISDKCDESIDFYTTEAGAAGSRYKGFAKTAAKRDSHYQVKTLTIDYLVNQLDIVPDLVKIDVEGAEREVLRGAIGLAKQQRSMFFVEIHSGPELSIEENTKGILEWCTANRYNAWYLKSKTKLELQDISERGRYHALLLPFENTIPDYLINIPENGQLAVLS